MELSPDRLRRARAVLIAGPTASGKSTAALTLAEAAARAGREAWIVNADSMQVYDALNVLTARPRAEDQRRAQHRLYGHVPAETRYSVGAWLQDLSAVLHAADAAGALVVAAGGTGLYFKAATEGLASIPLIPAAVREAMTARLKTQGSAALYDQLRRRDPAAAEAIRPGDTQRILRALEVLEATGRSLRDWQQMQAAPPLLAAGDVARFALEVPRATLYRRIDDRFDAMVSAGAVEEVQTLLSLGLDPELPVMKAIGVQAFAAYLNGVTSIDDAVAQAKMETRRYAKRQATWFRNQMAAWPRIGGEA